MIDRSARSTLIQYLNNKTLNKSLENGFGQLKDTLKIDDSPVKQTTEAVSQQSLISALTLSQLQSLNQTMTDVLEELKKLNEEKDGTVTE